MNITYITAFHPVRSNIGPYLEKFEKIASTGVPIILFLDTTCFLPTSYPNVKVIHVDMDLSWIPENVSLPLIRSQEKDTVRYLGLMLHKLKYMTEALEFCDTPYLAWIDFGISHIIRYPDVTFQKLVALQSFSNPHLKNILIAGCWGPNPNYDIWNNVYWRFCGGFFLGPRDIFPKAFQRQTELVQQHLPKLTWEVNYWTLMEEYFTFYQADHNDKMIMNVPYSSSIQRLTDEPYYIGGFRKVAAGGPVENYIYSCLPSNVTIVFPKTDMMVETSEFERMRNSTDWQDPAIHSEADIVSRSRPVAGTSAVYCVDTTRCIRSPSVLLFPSDDKTFTNGLQFSYSLPPWESRQPKVVWRGASSGCEYPSLRSKVAQELYGLSYADVKFTLGGWPQNDAKIPPEYFGEKMTIEQQLQYKYMLSIDGNGAASNIEWIFASGSVPIFVSNPNLNFWFKPLLEDRVNCILVNGNLREQIEWLLEHDSEAKQIAENALDFGRKIFSPEFQKAYIQNELKRIMDSICDISWKEYFGPPGLEHFRLLEKLGKSVKNRDIIDIGTHTGAEALALSKEKTNHVYSFDTQHRFTLLKLPNITYCLDNLMTPEGRERWREKLLGSAFIFLDVPSHDGILEYQFYEWLRDNQYKGFLICDDIWYFEPMRRNLWYKIPTDCKEDLTDEGHFSGTGIVRFEPFQKDISDWTVVTGYFDLTRMPDASPSIKSRPFEHYLQHSTSTLMLDQNMIIYCEPHTVEYIRAKRPKELEHKTRYIVMNFEDFPLSKYRSLVEKNRLVRPSVDDRNTVSYYLLCMARYAMLKKAITINPFGSTHFMWLNICIERMGLQNVRELPNIMRLHRDKFSTCYIDYQPRENYLENVMRYGKCSMCSGFFTGNAHYMKEFCDRIEQKFIECAEAGYGHADEQLYSLVYFDCPEIFEVYYGDYTEMITNYEWVRCRPSEPLRLIIPHSFAAKDYTTCLAACRVLWKSYEKGYAKLSNQEVNQLKEYLRALNEPTGPPA
jgi:hypothetical protein